MYIQDLNDSDHIWCEVCGVTPLMLDRLEADDRNDHAATDLICGKCHLVIATVHHIGSAEALRPK